MSGHSKWSTIKRKKGALDAKRSKIFTKLVKEIMVAVKVGGGSDPETNAKLRMAIHAAKVANLPKDNITRAISKAEGGDSMEEYVIEGYGPCGVAIFIECLTDNSTRTIQNVRAMFSKYGGNLGTIGSLAFIFDRKGVFLVNQQSVKMELDAFEMEMIDAGVEDISVDDGVVELVCSYEDFGKVQKRLEELKATIGSAQLQRLPKDCKHLNADDAMKVLKLIDALDDDDDVSNVFHNIEMTDEIAEAMG